MKHLPDRLWRVELDYDWQDVDTVLDVRLLHPEDVAELREAAELADDVATIALCDTILYGDEA